MSGITVSISERGKFLRRSKTKREREAALRSGETSGLRNRAASSPNIARESGNVGARSL